MEIILNNQKYDIIKDYKDAFNKEEIESKITDYYENFDYILGDYAYGKIRLKGFNEKSNKNFKPINDYQKIDEYLEKYCAYGCKYFILKKLK